MKEFSGVVILVIKAVDIFVCTFSVLVERLYQLLALNVNTENAFFENDMMTFQIDTGAGQ
jgi:hypothetical protein